MPATRYTQDPTVNAGVLTTHDPTATQANFVSEGEAWFSEVYLPTLAAASVGAWRYAARWALLAVEHAQDVLPAAAEPPSEWPLPRAGVAVLSLSARRAAAAAAAEEARAEYLAFLAEQEILKLRVPLRRAARRAPGSPAAGTRGKGKAAKGTAPPPARSIMGVHATPDRSRAASSSMAAGEWIGLAAVFALPFLLGGKKRRR